LRRPSGSPRRIFAVPGGSGHDDALAVAIAPADGSLFTAGYLQADTSGGVTFTSVTAANSQVVNGFAGQDGFLSKARESAPPCAALGAVQCVSPTYR
jgi:hypothetical protein